MIALLIDEAHTRFIGEAQPIEGKLLVRPGPLGLQWIAAHEYSHLEFCDSL